MYSIKTLEKTIEKISLSCGGEFFNNMTEALAQAVGADFCLIARVNDKMTISNTISVYAHGQHTDNFQYDLEGTPCQEVACGHVDIYPANVASLFPDDLLLTQMDIQAYVGASLKDTNSKVLGLVVALYHEKLEDPEPVHKLYTLFSSRIALEVDRMEKDRLLERLNRQLEERVRQRTKELEQANDEIKRFAYIVSHDLRAPLVNIKGFSSELKYSANDLKKVLSKSGALSDENFGEELQCIINDDIPEALDFIETSVSKMDGQINAILNLSRLGSRKLSLEPIEMDTLVKEQLSLLQHQIDDNHVAVVLENLPVLVADRLSMEQIFANLLGNAVKYCQTDQKGMIKISAEPQLDAQNTQTTFHITDNGRGIAKQELSDVFELFKRAGDQDTVGEGMGLAYVKTLVQLQGGRIWCSSELNKGSTFSFLIAQTEDASHG